MKYTGKCVLPSSYNTNSNNAATKRGSDRTLFNGLLNGVAKEFYGQSCEVTGYNNTHKGKVRDAVAAAAVASPRLVIYDGTGGRGDSSIAVNVDLSRCEAIAANADYPIPPEYILTVRLLQPQPQQSHHQPSPKHHWSRDSKEEYSRTATGEDATRELLGALSPFDLRLEVPIDIDDHDHDHVEKSYEADVDGACDGVGSREAPTLPSDAVLLRSSGLLAASVGAGPALVVPLASEDLRREGGLPEVSVAVAMSGSDATTAAIKVVVPWRSFLTPRGQRLDGAGTGVSISTTEGMLRCHEEVHVDVDVTSLRQAVANNKETTPSPVAVLHIRGATSLVPSSARQTAATATATVANSTVPDEAPSSSTSSSSSSSSITRRMSSFMRGLSTPVTPSHPTPFSATTPNNNHTAGAGVLSLLPSAYCTVAFVGEDGELFPPLREVT